jgi:hypothetical protein
VARWEIEKGYFRVRDVLFREDASQVRVLAGLRALRVSLLHREGVREKKAALEAFSFNPLCARKMFPYRGSSRFLGLYAV